MRRLDATLHGPAQAGRAARSIAAVRCPSSRSTCPCSTALYYILGFYSSHSSHTEHDGKFRRIQIRLADGTKAELTYRQGYYAHKVWAKKNTWSASASSKRR